MSGVVLILDDIENRLNPCNHYNYGPCTLLTHIVKGLKIKYDKYKLLTYIVCNFENFGFIIEPERNALQTFCNIVDTKSRAKQSADNKIIEIAHYTMNPFLNKQGRFYIPFVLVIISNDNDFSDLTKEVYTRGGTPIVLGASAVVGKHNWNYVQFYDMYKIGSGQYENFLKQKTDIPGSKTFDMRSHNTSPVVCRTFLSGKCHRGSACKFSHVSPHDTPSLKKTDPTCKYSKKKLACTRDNCKFTHILMSGVVCMCYYFEGFCKFRSCRFIHAKKKEVCFAKGCLRSCGKYHLKHVRNKV